MLLEGFQLVKLQRWPRCGVSEVRYESRRAMVCNCTHERRLAGSMIDDEFGVICFELLLSLVLAKRRL
jgi:hypothetical protein